jgi:hypothetical protein
MIDSLMVARKGAGRLGRLIDQSGRFRYSFDPDRPDADRGYNILRHCGTIWAMVEVSNRLERLPDVVSAARRATERLIERYIQPHRSGTASCVVGKDNVKLGGNGLAILALLEVAEARREERYVEIARRLAEYILLQRLPDGDFTHKRRYSTDEPMLFLSDYYTGEALFGLLRLHAVTGDRRWLEEAKISEIQLAARDYGVAPQSHWMLYALEQFHRFDPLPLYRYHAQRIVADIMRKPAYRDTHRSTPLACRSEGVLAYIRLLLRLPLSPEIAAEIAQCQQLVRENLELQLNYWQKDGSFIRGGDNAGSREVRIDYIQHNISSFLGYGLLDGATPLEKPDLSEAQSTA